MTELPTHVDIRDVSLRDGLQIEEPIPLSAKLELLAAVAATGVRCPGWSMNCSCRSRRLRGFVNGG